MLLSATYGTGQVLKFISTDHAILQFDIQIKTEKTQASRCFVYDYHNHNTDFKRLREAVQAENLSAVIDPTKMLMKISLIGLMF